MTQEKKRVEKKTNKFKFIAIEMKKVLCKIVFQSMLNETEY